MTFLIFLKKELFESIKTSKALIIAAIFVFFALVSPVTARYVNEILASVGDLGDFKLPDPTYIDSFTQFFKNYNTVGMLALIFAFMGTLSREKESKTVYLMLTKGLSRKNMYLSKFFSATIVYTIVYIISALIFHLYTVILFGDFSNDKILLAYFIYWFYGIFTISMTVFFSNISNSISVVATLSIVSYFILTFLTMVDVIKFFIPATLSAIPMELITGTLNNNDYIITIVSTFCLVIILIISGINIFKEQEL